MNPAGGAVRVAQEGFRLGPSLRYTTSSGPRRPSGGESAAQNAAPKIQPEMKFCGHYTAALSTATASTIGAEPEFSAIRVTPESPEARKGERKTVTTLFDIKGSMDLMEGPPS